MRWTGVGMTAGIALLAVGGVIILGGLAVTLAGPGTPAEGDALQPSADGRAQDTQEARAVGALVMATGAILAFVGGILYGIARDAEAKRETEQPAEPPRKQMPLT